MDLTLAIVPITIVWNLKLNIHKRLGLLAVLGAGVM